MPAAMHLTALVFLFGVTLCRGDAISTPTTQMTTSAAADTSQPTGLAATTTNVTSTVTSTTVDESPSITHRASTLPTSQEVSSSPPPPTSQQTPNTQTMTTKQTVSETVSSGPTLQPEAKTTTYTATTTVNTSNQGGSADWGKGDMKKNPGLVAVLCIFSVVLVLVLVVVIIKCVQSPRSKFERLEDMPMGKVSEDAPFAHYSK